jgi:heme-degrading monooxygenase HmoA
MSNVEKFVKVVEETKGEGYLGVAYGETMEDVKKHADQGKDGVKEGKAVVLLIGWESKELHMKFRETDTFKENIHFLREKTGGVEMVSFDSGECHGRKLTCVQAHVPFKAV